MLLPPMWRWTRPRPARVRGRGVTRWYDRRSVLAATSPLMVRVARVLGERCFVLVDVERTAGTVTERPQVPAIARHNEPIPATGLPMAKHRSEQAVAIETADRPRPAHVLRLLHPLRVPHLNDELDTITHSARWLQANRGRLLQENPRHPARSPVMLEPVPLLVRDPSRRRRHGAPTQSQIPAALTLAQRSHPRTQRAPNYLVNS